MYPAFFKIESICSNFFEFLKGLYQTFSFEKILQTGYFVLRIHISILSNFKSFTLFVITFSFTFF